MKTYVKDENANKQVNIIATLVSSGKSDAEIANHLTKTEVVNLAYAEVFWSADDVEQIRTDHGLAPDGMKLCPSCRKEIKKEAIKCRHCGTDLTSGPPAPKSTKGALPNRQATSRDIADASYAELGERFVAGLLDGLILVIPYLLASALLPIVGSLIVGAAYYMYFFSENGGGRTIGYRVMNLRLVDQQSLTPISAGTAALWYLIFALVSIIGWIWFFFDSQKRMLHNIASHTIVINERKEDAT
jgi:uncharacterized RDD family membrane protein YckC